MADEMTNTKADSTESANSTGSTAKKSFEPPRLTVYGDIATLTRSVGRTGVPDNGHGSNVRTST